MPIKTEMVAYCDVCHVRIVGNVKGFNIHGTFELLNETDENNTRLDRTCTESKGLSEERSLVICRQCFCDCLDFEDKRAQKSKGGRLFVNESEDR